MRDTDPFREMYLKIYKAIKHTLVRTVLCTHACLQECYGLGHLPCREQPEDSEEPTELGEPSRDTRQPENTMQVTAKCPVQKHSTCPASSLEARGPAIAGEVGCPGALASVSPGDLGWRKLSHWVDSCSLMPSYFALSCCWKFS